MKELAAAARAARRVGLFGGSFDPVHRGHLHAASAARRAFDLEHVVFVPAARPPHKPGRALVAGEHRVAMLRRALAGEADWTSIWEVELERVGPSFTVDTLRELHAQRAGHGAEQPFLILGSDNLSGLGAWREVEAVLELARPIVVHRAGFGSEALAALATSLSTGALQALRDGLVELPPDPASSSEVRQRIARGAVAGDDVADDVREYIRSHGFYASDGPSD